MPDCYYVIITKLISTVFTPRRETEMSDRFRALNLIALLGVAGVMIVIIPYSKQRLKDVKTLTVAVVFFDLFIFVNYKDR
jgi:hypothetical protein